MKIERNLSENTIISYLADVNKLLDFLQKHYNNIDLKKVNYDILSEFISQIIDEGLDEKSQSRIISGIRSFLNTY